MFLVDEGGLVVNVIVFLREGGGIMLDMVLCLLFFFWLIVVSEWILRYRLSGWLS